MLDRNGLATSADISALAEQVTRTLDHHWRLREQWRLEFPAIINEAVFALSDTALTIPQQTNNPYLLTAILYSLQHTGTLQLAGNDELPSFRLQLPSGVGCYQLGPDGYIVLPRQTRTITSSSAGEIAVCLIGHEIPIRNYAGGAN